MSNVSMQGVLSLSPRWVDGNTVAADSVQSQFTLAHGYASGQANAYWRSQISIANGATHNVDLTSLSLSVFGASGSIYLASVKTLLLMNTSERTEIAVDPEASNAWAEFSPGGIGPGAMVMLHEPAGTGRVVTGASKVLSLVNADATVSLAGTATGTTITGLSSTSNLYAGMLLGATHPSGAKIAAIASTTSVTTTVAATANGADTFDFIPPPAVVDVIVVGVLD